MLPCVARSLNSAKMQPRQHIFVGPSMSSQGMLGLIKSHTKGHNTTLIADETAEEFMAHI